MEEEIIERRKIALFGGSFDPVTNAHVSIIKNLCERFDKVVVIPCFISPFKLSGKIELANSRVKMLEKVFDDNEKVKISKWEIRREQASYTYITMQHFAEKYPDDDLYFVIGSDALPTLSKWKNVAEIAKCATFYLVRRPYFSISQSKLQQLSKNGIKVILADFPGEVGSSSEARVANAFSLLSEVVPYKVAKFIAKHELYNDYRYVTATYQIFNLKPERIAHTYRTVKSGIALAKLYGVNVDSAITALLLHDIGKYSDEALLNRLNINVSAGIYHMPEPIRHAPISAAIARDHFNITDPDVLRAIEMHTTGCARMTQLQMIVYIADAIEEGRDYEGVDELRKLAAISLEKCMLAALKHCIDHVSKKGDVYYKTLDAYEYFNNKEVKTMPTIKKTVVTTEEATAKKVTKKVAAPKVDSAEAAPVKKVAVKKVTAPKAEGAETATAKKVAKKVAAPKVEKPKAINPNDGALQLAEYIAARIDEKKGKDIVIVPLEGKTIIADYFVIATAGSSTQVRALTDYVDEKLSKDYNIEPLRRDIDAKWAAVDYGSIILHVMHEEAREMYQIERLWADKNSIKSVKTED